MLSLSQRQRRLSWNAIKSKASIRLLGKIEKSFLVKDIRNTYNTDFYNEHPCSSWGRGTNAKTNGSLRQYLHKGTGLEMVNDDTCQFIMDRLNNRPRKCLGYRTPKQIFEEYLEVA